jgi:hypothetical protein
VRTEGKRYREIGGGLRFENWIAGKDHRTEEMDWKAEQLLARLEVGYGRKLPPEVGGKPESE